MPTGVTIPIAASLDDQRIFRQSTTWAGVPTGTLTRDTTVTSVPPQRSFTTPNYIIQNALLRWNTSLYVPASAIVSSADLLLYQNGRVNTNSLSISGGAYAWDGTSSTDWTYAPEADAFAAVPFSTFSANGVWYDISLLSPDTLVSKTGYTNIRISVTEMAADAAPTGQNLLDFRNYDYDEKNGTDYKPRLVLSWSMPGASVASLPPNAILSDTNLTGAVTDIDDDPDAADANWLTAP